MWGLLCKPELSSCGYLENRKRVTLSYKKENCVVSTLRFQGPMSQKIGNRGKARGPRYTAGRHWLSVSVGIKICLLQLHWEGWDCWCSASGLVCCWGGVCVGLLKAGRGHKARTGDFTLALKNTTLSSNAAFCWWRINS